MTLVVSYNDGSRYVLEELELNAYIYAQNVGQSVGVRELLPPWAFIFDSTRETSRQITSCFWMPTGYMVVHEGETSFELSNGVLRLRSVSCILSNIVRRSCRSHFVRYATRRRIALSISRAMAARFLAKFVPIHC